MTANDADLPGGSGEGEVPGSVDDAVWTELVAAFHAAPSPEEGGWPEAENLPPAAPEPGHTAGAITSDAGGTPSRVVRPAARPEPPEHPVIPSSVTWIEGGSPLTTPSPLPTPPPPGPRDWGLREDAVEEGFTPPTPPPLPEIAVATKAAWLAALGGPGFLAVSTVLHWNTPSWAALLCVLGGVAGFGFLVSRLKDRPGGDSDDPDDPTYGAVL